MAWGPFRGVVASAWRGCSGGYALRARACKSFYEHCRLYAFSLTSLGRCICSTFSTFPLVLIGDAEALPYRISFHSVFFFFVAVVRDAVAVSSLAGTVIT